MEIGQYRVIYNSEENHWWYRGRRFLLRYLLNQCDFDQNSLILDYGCGTGFLIKDLNNRGLKVLGMDSSPESVKLCQQRGLSNVFHGSVDSWPQQLSGHKFDAILLLDVLEHVKDDSQALLILKNKLNPEGKIIVFVPAFSFLWSVNDDFSHHFRRYTKRELVKKMSNIGFKVKWASYFNFLLFIPILLIRLLNRITPLYKQENNLTNNNIINTIFSKLFHLELFLIRFFSYPFGVSIAIVVEKNDQ